VTGLNAQRPPQFFGARVEPLGRPLCVTAEHRAGRQPELRHVPGAALLLKDRSRFASLGRKGLRGRLFAGERFGGLWCPSEVLSLEWRHVDWERGRLTVPRPRPTATTARQVARSRSSRNCRRTGQKRLHLTEPGQTHVTGGDHLAKANGPNGWKECNLRTTFDKLVKRAGLEPWPRLFHNLRLSRETELLEEFSVHVVALWMGHDAKVSLKHYAQMTEEHFDRAASGAESGSPEAQNAAQRIPAASRREILYINLAEREGFEPSVRLPVHSISSAAQSTTLPPRG